MESHLLESNREAGTGRPDLILRHPSIRGEAVILELKTAENPNLLELRCEEALEQIQTWHYREGLETRGYQKIFAYGISFYGKDCCVMKL